MNKRFFTGIILLILLFAFAAAACAQNGFTFELTEGYSFEEKTDNWAISISLPQISGMADADEQAELNAYILGKKDEMLTDYRENVSSAEQGVKEGYDPHFGYQYTWDVVTDNDDYFVFRISWFFAAGSATTLNEYFNLDRKTGRLLVFEKDAVTTPEEMASVREQILTQMKAANEESQKEYGADIFWTEDDSLDTSFAKVSELNHWYYNENNELVIAFDKYEIAPGAAGSPEFTVSL